MNPKDIGWENNFYLFFKVYLLQTSQTQTQVVSFLSFSLYFFEFISFQFNHSLFLLHIFLSFCFLE